MAELADALDLGSNTTGVQVQVLSPAPFKIPHLYYATNEEFWAKISKNRAFSEVFAILAISEKPDFLIFNLKKYGSYNKSLLSKDF